MRILLGGPGSANYERHRRSAAPKTVCRLLVSYAVFGIFKNVCAMPSWLRLWLAHGGSLATFPLYRDSRLQVPSSVTTTRMGSCR